MRVAHIITRMIIGGAQENTLLNCVDLIEEHHDEVMLITGPAIGPEGDLLERGGFLASESGSGESLPGNGRSQGRAGELKNGALEITLLPDLLRNIHPGRDWKAYQAIRKTLKAYQPDVVHTHSAKGGLLGRLAAWSLGVPAVIHTVHGAPFHDFQPRLAKEFFRRCERYASKRCHRILCVADAMTDLMVDANVASRDRFTTVYSGMNVDPFVNANEHRAEVRSRYGIEDHHVVIGKVARLFHLKGHDDLIKAAAEVVKVCPEVRFMLVGDGILREELQRQIDQLGLEEHFIFTGLVSPETVPELIGAMDVLVHTSLREGLARALPQALIAGKPAVSFDIDGAREVVISDQTGYLIPPRDCQALADALIRLGADAELRQRMGREGQRRFTERFRHQSMTNQIRQIYQEVLAGR
ncbi:glycosyltransferase family 4 protein [Rhodopirellula sp. MGV]|uniref:glycosyltransferase family 4 protein n=1 Tax=Rhodopirellula sp. MGV TaxID=2023130 RepID=UPI000B96833C|nr:glycosyltransferase family 4 protein [Rhodopirellula sp. MGV]OYP30373.1 glycosyl transferase family 1 [Rhodopirellula sp. MGV]PNY34729.1 glycosyltransferase family 1 protein [Rhodopirellula baltica]